MANAPFVRLPRLHRVMVQLGLWPTATVWRYGQGKYPEGMREIIANPITRRALLQDLQALEQGGQGAHRPVPQAPGTALTNQGAAGTVGGPSHNIHVEDHRG